MNEHLTIKEIIEHCYTFNEETRMYELKQSVLDAAARHKAKKEKTL